MFSIHASLSGWRSQILLLAFWGGWVAVSHGATLAPSQDLVVIGEVVCVGPDGGYRGDQPDCTRAGLAFGFRTDGGEVLNFVPEDPRVPIFADSRVRRRRFRIVARQRPAGLEIVQIHAIEKGRLIRLYYFCEVCTIEAYAPGPCWCCQQDFQFREEPETRFDLMRPDGRSPDSEETWNR